MVILPSLTVVSIITIFRGSVMDKVIKVFGTVFSIIFDNLSPEIKKLIQNFVKDLYEKAKKTDSVFDDLGVKVLAAVLNVDLE